MKNIAGVFYARSQAHGAIATLLDRGFTQGDISVIMSDEAKQRHFHDSSNAEEIAAGGGSGAAAGGVLGGLLAGLAAIGTITIPGIGLLAAGPIMAVLSGIGAGAAIGGLAGALTTAGISASEAKHYEDEIKKGNIVLVVHTKTEEELLVAHDAMRQHEAITETL